MLKLLEKDSAPRNEIDNELVKTFEIYQKSKNNSKKPIKDLFLQDIENLTKNFTESLITLRGLETDTIKKSQQEFKSEIEQILI